MHKLNPNHPVSEVIDDDFMHKIAAILIMRAGGSAFVSVGDIDNLRNLFGGEMPVLITRCHADSMEFTLMRESEAMELAREAGGLPQ